MTYGRIAFPLLTALLAAGPIQARELPVDRDGLRADAATQRLAADRAILGLDARHAFQAVRTHQDQLGQTHVRFQQTFNGVKVWGGEVILHQAASGAFRPHTLAHAKGIELNTTPALTAAEALAIAHHTLTPKGDYAYAPTSELVIVPTGAASYALAYHVHTQLENGSEETKHTDFMIDAHTGAILKQWNSLRTSDATGTANTQYSGVRSIHTNLNGSSYELKDLFRPMNISTYNLNHATSGTGTLYTDADNTWGDGANYVEGSSTTAANGQTAGVDAHFGIEVTYDFYKNIMGRNGIDGANRATYSRVHYSNSYDNAFWDDTCFCMTYGDGSSFTTLTALDVAGHEMSHGVCANTANLTYSGESGGLNESDSDILGNMVELYSKSSGTLPSSVANTDNCWLLGEQLASTPLRYMYKPSKDGSSADAWYSGVGNLNVHYSSGPNNRMFFFLSQGASATSSSDYYSSYTPSGFTGIGPAKAAQIWYRALSVYLTSSSNYAAARTAVINAAKDLYGAGGAEEAAAWNAYAAINVGSAWTGNAALAASITTPSSNVTVASGSAVSFAGAASGGTSPYTYSWTFGDGGTASTASASHTYTNTGSTAVNYTATFTVTDSASHTASATRTITVNPAAGVSVVVSPASVSLNTGATQQFTASVTGSTNTAVTWSVVEAGGGSVTTSGLYTAPATAGTYHVKATSQADSTKSAQATVTVSSSTGSTELIKNGGFESGATSWTATSGVIGANGSSEPTHGGTYDAWMCGYGSTHTDSVYQAVAIPSSAASATLSFWLHIDTAETTTTTAYDTLKVQVRNSSGTVLATLATYSNLNKGTGYTQKSFDLSAYKGQTVQIYFVGAEDSSLQTSFVLDDVSVKVQ